MSISTACVDASFVVRLFLGPDDDICWDLLENWLPTVACCMPRLAALRARERHLSSPARRTPELGHGGVGPRRGARPADTCREDPPLHRAALRIAQSCDTAAAYDAHYVALAKRLGAELWTADRRLAGHAASSGVTVNVVGAPRRRSQAEAPIISQSFCCASLRL